jgi:hypothetical protein
VGGKKMYLEQKLDEIKEILMGFFSPYLTLNEASEYLRLSQSTIKKQMGKSLFFGKHYFKPTGDKILFAKIELDNWVKEGVITGENQDGIDNKKRQHPLDKVISEWRDGQKINGID